MKLILVLVLLSSSVCSSLHSFDRYLLSIRYVPGTLLGTEDTTVKESE